MREYEVTIVFNPQLEDEARNQQIERVGGWLTFGEDESAKPVVNLWGQRHLAYPIKKLNEGYYVLYNAKIDPTKLGDLERNIKYNENVIRYLIILKEEA